MATTRTAPNGFMNTRSAVLGLARAAFLGARWAKGAPLAAMEHLTPETPEEEAGLVMLYILSAVLVLAGGAFAGLTIAFMGQDGIYLKVLKDDVHESHRSRRSAEKVLNLLNQGKHWVLVTLLLANVIVNESLPVVLDRCLGGGIAAIVGSTILIVIFGEVVPQSVCVRYGLTIGGFMAGPVLMLMWLTAPLSWPMAKLLDWILGTHEGTIYKKSGLKTLVTLHQSIGEVSERLNTDEVTIIRAVLDLKAKSVGAVMTPMEDVFTLSASAILDERLMDKILSAGYSRIPVYSPDNSTNFIGMLLVKILITYDPEDCMQVKDFPLAALPETRPDTSCLDILNYFQDGKSHMAIVSQAPGKDHGAIGVVTLEDVIEELIGEEIVDESDVYIDVHKAIRRIAPAPTTTFRRESINANKASPSEAAAQTDGDSKRNNSVSAFADGASSGSPNKTLTFMVKRRSTEPGVEPATVPVKHHVDQVRQHLSRHLSPRNPAANPKNIKSSTITIKPGTGATATPSSRQLELSPEPPAIEAEAEDERAPLLGSRPAATASEGSFHATPDYGSANPAGGQIGAVSGPALESSGSIEVVPSEDAAVRVANKDNEEAREAERLEQPIRSHTSESTGSAGMPTPFRAGSITESYVHTGGVRKIVISSSSGDEDEANGVGTAENAAGEPAQGSNEEIGAPSGGTREQPSEADTQGEGHDEGDKGQGAQASSAGQGSGQDKKKKKKGKKGKGKK